METPLGGLAVAPPVAKPVPAQEVALVEFQRSIVDWPTSISLSSTERVAVGVNIEQLGGLVAPLLQEGPGPHPPLQTTQLVPFHTRGRVQVLQAG